MCLIRVNSYEKFGLPGRPVIEIRVMKSQWLVESDRAENLKSVLEYTESHREHTIEQAQYGE